MKFAFEIFKVPSTDEALREKLAVAEDKLSAQKKCSYEKASFTKELERCYSL